MTEEQLKVWLMSKLRRISYQWPPRAAALKDVRIGWGHYYCQACGATVLRSGLQVHHIDSVISTTEGFVDWDVYIKRLFVGVNEYAVLCKPCHTEITNEENEERRENGV